MGEQTIALGGSEEKLVYGTRKKHLEILKV